MKIAAILLLTATLMGAQDADTVVLKNDARKFTIASQLEDPAEAAAFVRLIATKEPEKRYSGAQEFARLYPQSWVLAQVYDVSARSAIDLGRYEDALRDGRFSLRMLPENASLLVLMANIEAQRNEGKLAVEHASEALEYLSEMERPSNLSPSEWNVLQPELKSSAYFARARATATGTQANLKSALGDLNSAAAWNPEDAEVFYLRAVVEIRMGQKRAAGADLAYVAGSSSTLCDKAKSLLQHIDQGGAAEGWGERAVDANLRREPVPETEARELAYGYAGPEACQGCHEKEYLAWRKTGMARMLQPYRAENIIGDFSAQYEDPQAIRVGSHGRPYFEVHSRGEWSRYYVDFTIGSKWQQAYATKLPDGRLQVLPIEYNALQKRWVNYWKVIDPPDSVRANIAEFPKLGAATNYQQNCAICHTSQLRADLSAASSMEHATYLQPGVDCEMCHGPAAWHVKHPESRLVDFRTISNRDGVKVCAQCHRQSAVREIGAAGEMNFSTKVSFTPATWLRPYDAFSRRAFYKDGRFRETTFIVEAFTRSACYLRGTAQCASCHSPHLGDFENNQTALKFRGKENEMCLGCHSDYRNRVAEHSRHPAGSEASQCVTCHMPRIVNALLFKARSHQIEVPAADLTERFGQQDSPNVCLTCHAEKDAGWARKQISAWRH